MNEFEQYKELMRKDEFILDLKKEVARILCRKKLFPVMNDTKWLELQKAVESLSFPPPYIVKCVTEEQHYPFEPLGKLPNHLGNWRRYNRELITGLPPFFNIEWIKVLPKYKKSRGRLVTDEIVDETEDFIAILDKFSIPYENEEGTITVYGYK